MFVLNVRVACQHRILDILRAPKGCGRQKCTRKIFRARGRSSAGGAENEVWLIEIYEMLLVQFQSSPVTVTILYKDDKLSMLIYLGIRHSVDQEKRLSALNQGFLNKSCSV